MSHDKKGFTLVEMLIVIVIIGILAAALIPRLTGMQARARDTARDVDLRNIAIAFELYQFDNGSYPLPIYNTIAHTSSQITSRDLLAPRVSAQGTSGSNLNTLSESILSQYLKSVPRDPRRAGVKATSGRICIDEGDSYAYNSDGMNYFAIIAISESKNGNTSSCGDSIDHIDGGHYKKEGRGLMTNIYPSPSQWTKKSCFNFGNGVIYDYNNSCAKDLIIPFIIDNTFVTTIGQYAFQYQELNSAYIPHTIRSIGRSAFLNNNLTEIIIPEGIVSIGNASFRGNNMTEVFIPNSVTSVANYAFWSNPLTSVSIGPHTPSNRLSWRTGCTLASGCVTRRQ